MKSEKHHGALLYHQLGEGMDCIPSVMGSRQRGVRPDSGFRLTLDVSGKQIITHCLDIIVAK